MPEVSVLALALCLAPLTALADYHSRTVAAGGRLKAEVRAALNPDCSLAGYPDIRVTSAPSNGRIVSSRVRDFVYFPPQNPRSVCNTRRVPATLIEYRPNPGYVGSDTFTIDLIFPNGADLSDTFNVNVK